MLKQASFAYELTPGAKGAFDPSDDPAEAMLASKSNRAVPFETTLHAARREGKNVAMYAKLVQS